jgi:hypothetical protein
MPVDRRARRAVAPLLAAEYFLDAERARAKASVIVLMDGSDVLASSVAAGEDLDAVARAGAAVAAGRVPADDRDLYAHTLRLGGRDLVLATADARVRSVREIERHLGRILSA